MTTPQTADRPSPATADRERQDPRSAKPLFCLKRTVKKGGLPTYVIFFPTVVLTIGVEQVMYAGPSDFFLATGLKLSTLRTAYQEVAPDKEPELMGYVVSPEGDNSSMPRTDTTQERVA